jgi:O-6-methylguanine DNA methyltransferase
MVASLALVTLVTPDGPFHVAVSASGVVAAELDGDRDAFTDRLAVRFHGLTAPDPAAEALVARVRPRIEAILADAQRDLTTIPLDLRVRAPFDRAVLLAVRDVPWGVTASYGEIARRIGAPRSARAVGRAVARCPISILIPCHRIIAADGTLGGYGGDGPSDRLGALATKRERLLREGVTVRTRAP